MMQTPNLVDYMLEALALETQCALSYVVGGAAAPSSIDGDDSAAQKTLAACWEREEPFLDRLIELVSDVGGSEPVIDSTYRFAPSRLNFARWSHILGVVTPLVEEEIAALEDLRERAGDQSPDLAKVTADLLAAKRSNLEEISQLHAKQVAAKAKAAEAAAAGESEKSDGGGGDDIMAFRDPDMEIEDRMGVVSKASLELKLWAAMAQTDCTACGYDCEGYAKAIAAGEDKDLTKCVPGEDVTENQLKSLMSK